MACAGVPEQPCPASMPQTLKLQPKLELGVGAGLISLSGRRSSALGYCLLRCARLATAVCWLDCMIGCSLAVSPQACLCSNWQTPALLCTNDAVQHGHLLHLTECWEQKVNGSLVKAIWAEFVCTMLFLYLATGTICFGCHSSDISTSSTGESGGQSSELPRLSASLYLPDTILNQGARGSLPAESGCSCALPDSNTALHTDAWGVFSRP